MNTFAAVGEMIMMICFGLSWPINIYKALQARTAKGTSVLFYFFILFGYLVGIAAKVALVYANPGIPWYITVKWYVLFFYVLNSAMVFVGILIYFRNKKIDLQNQKEVNNG